MSHFSPLCQISHPLFTFHQLKVEIKRDDLIHPIISGNKWRKLKYNLIQAKKQNKNSILSFGGAFSNHIHALAFACHQQGIASIGIIRGEKEYANNFTLRWAQQWGMKLIFVDRKTYKLRHNADYLAVLQQQYPQSFIVPEGGSNYFALQGVAELSNELQQQTEYNTLILPIGSGGTLAGLVLGDNSQHQLLAISVLKQAKLQQDYLTNDVQQLLKPYNCQAQNWQIMTNFHRGGYGKFSPKDCQRIIEFSQHTNIPFEPIYSGKMLLGFLDLVEQGYFNAGEKIVLLHTGGLQGLGGLAERKLIQAQQWSVPPAAEGQ